MPYYSGLGACPASPLHAVASIAVASLHTAAGSSSRRPLFMLLSQRERCDAEICLAGCGLPVDKVSAQDAEMQLFHEIQQFGTDAGSNKSPAFLAGGLGEVHVQRA